MTRRFDVAVIGSGSGNTLIDRRFRDRDVALIESGVFGGTCLNVGCIPTKMFVHGADVARTVRSAARFGVDATVEGVRWPDVIARVFGRVDPLSENGERHRIERSDHVTLLRGHARFVGDRELALDSGERISADQVIVAAGSRPVVPDVVTESGVPFHTSDTVMRIPALPERLIVIGGGAIAAEFAHVFSALGSDVHVVARGPALLRSLDADISARFAQGAHSRWNVHTDATVTHVTGDDAGSVTVTLDSGEAITGDTLLVATGRVSNADRLGAAAGGIDVTEDGLVAVDEFQRTSAPGVWALGDVSSPH
ncbi:mycothione reductase [Rhodococcus rhodnii LMG 5362]|uniref:Mycothione reductase n=1 Tax=Rhodococcus rhodnii LMG 5362 TaxID=1273125 RepID=R7WL63_9NOCA|nr:mycothione reductase [Rhodococcus rhodnii LMG 5362]